MEAMEMLLSGRGRGGWISWWAGGQGGDQSGVAQLGPERRGDGLVEGRDVLGDAAGPGRTRDHGGGRRMGEGELQGGRLDADAMPLGEFLDARDLLDDVRGSVLVLEVGAAREDAGAVRAADDEVDTLLGRRGEQALQGAVVVQQRVAPGEQEGVRLRLVQVEGELNGLDAVDAEAPCLDHALVAQPLQDAEGAGAGTLVDGEPLVAVEVLGDVVDPDDVEPVGAQAPQAVLDRPQGGVGRPLVHDLVGTAVFEQTALLAEVTVGGVLHLVEDDATHLRAEHVLVAGAPGERVAEANLRQAGAVEGGGVVVTDAVLPGGVDGGGGLLGGDVAEHAAQRCGAEAEATGEQGLDGHEGSLRRGGGGGLMAFGRSAVLSSSTVGSVLQTVQDSLG
ncbi:hypothetical protein SSPO_082740 [Streptomyces antimycoticus]|uniref:Uncharacterized protein n=1 Tax=Streptomyces antimycoticus TaxID=68175 RepID=A0A499VBI7_9ACTN|nr:hypothetical protein SSPO_082740 [Streptomyces antimycoticus]